MDINLIIAYVMLILFGWIFLAQGLPLVFEQWKKYQEKRADKILSKFENIFVFVDKKKIKFIFLILPPALFVVFYVLFHNFLLALPGFVLGLFLPITYIRQLERMRRTGFSKQLIDALMIISNSLKAGLSMLQAMEVLVEEMPSPVKDEFNLVVREIKMGISLEEAMMHLNARMHSEEMDLITSAILVAKETGGDLTKVFSRLIDTIRERYKLKELVSTLTLQGRLQGFVMSIIPIAFTYFVYKFSPGHFDIMLKDERGKMMLYAACIFQVLALICIKKFSVVKV